MQVCVCRHARGVCFVGVFVCVLARVPTCRACILCRFLFASARSDFGRNSSPENSQWNSNPQALNRLCNDCLSVQGRDMQIVSPGFVSIAELVLCFKHAAFKQTCG